MPGHDESARSAGVRGSRLDALPPGVGDFRGLVERLPLIIYIDEPDPKSPSLYISPETTVMLGYTPEDWAASPDFFVSICHPDDLERAVILSDGVAAGRELFAVHDEREGNLGDDSLLGASRAREQPQKHCGEHRRLRDEAHDHLLFCVNATDASDERKSGATSPVGFSR